MVGAMTEMAAIIVRISLPSTVDTATVSGIVAITWFVPYRLEVEGAGKARQQALESRGPPRRGHVEPSSREGPRSEVSGRGVLRSPRCRAGQIRDAAPRLDRERAGDGGFRRIRRFKTYLLPGQGELRRSGRRRAGAQEARPSRSAQDPRGGVDVSQEQLVPGEPIRARELARLIRQEFDLDVHPRTIERVVAVKKTSR